MEGFGGQMIMLEQAVIALRIGKLPPQVYKVHVAPIAEYILGVNVLKELVISTILGDFRWHIRAVKSIVSEHPNHAPLVVPQASPALHTKKFWLLGGHELFGHTFSSLKKPI